MIANRSMDGASRRTTAPSFEPVFCALTIDEISPHAGVPVRTFHRDVASDLFSHDDSLILDLQGQAVPVRQHPIIERERIA